MARKNNQQNIKALQIKLTNLDTILKWSKGEILNAKTINYKNGLPDDGGLFDQRIFGPIKDYQCACGKYKGIRYKGRVCEKCGVEVIKSAVRRERMAHIMLSTPVVHTWFANDLPNPSKISLVLGLDNNDVRNIIYYQSYIITDNAGYKKYFENKQIITFDEKFEQFNKSRFVCKKILNDEILPKLTKGSSDYDAAHEMVEQLTHGDYTFNIDAILEFISDKTGIKFAIGAEAILELLKNIKLSAEIKSLKSKINPDSPTFNKDVNRLKILN
jgi:DNA-directed RNA polymerase subunit beta'